MQTIQISDTLYARILRCRNGEESVGATINRALDVLEIESEEGWNTAALDADLNQSISESKKLYTHDEVFQ